jgi:hypothetical protein
VRTTLTLDDDVAVKLEAERRRRGTSFKETLNAVLRRGFEMPPPEELATTFRVESRPMGLRPGLRLDDIGGLIEELDGPARR